MKIKADSKREIQKTGGTTGDLIGNITVYKITNFSKNHQKIIQMELIMKWKYQKKYIHFQKKATNQNQKLD